MSDTNERAAEQMLEDVHSAISGLVELLQTYKNKNKLERVLVSSLFKKREEEAEAVLSTYINRLQVSQNAPGGQ